MKPNRLVPQTLLTPSTSPARAGSTVVLLLLVACGSPPEETPPASDILLLTLETETAAGRVVVTGDPVAVTDRPDGYDNQPMFTPDGDALLYTSIRDGQADTYRYDLATGRHLRLTRTPESEYSPTPIPGSDRFSVVRVEGDGTQRLWSFAADGGDPRLILPDVAPVGYHAWVDPYLLALFVLGDPSTLQIAAPGPGQGQVVASGIGRAIQAVPGRPAITFTQELDGEWWLRELDGEAGTVRTVAPLLAPDLYHAHTPAGAILAAHGPRIYRLRSEPAAGVEPADLWDPVADLSEHGVGQLTRLAVSPDGRRLAVVVE